MQPPVGAPYFFFSGICSSFLIVQWKHASLNFFFPSETNFHPDKAFNEVFLILFDILKPKRLRTNTPTLRPYKADLPGHIIHFMTYISA